MLPLWLLIVHHTLLLVRQLPTRLPLPLLHNSLVLFLIQLTVLLFYLLLMHVMLRLMRHIHPTQGMHIFSTLSHLIIRIYPLPCLPESLNIHHDQLGLQLFSVPTKRSKESSPMTMTPRGKHAPERPKRRAWYRSCDKWALQT
jgi:hypothetical protein